MTAEDRAARQRAEAASADTARLDYVASIVSATLVARWALPVAAAVESERVARQGTNGLGLVLLAPAGLEISGDHRPREHDDGFTDERVIPCLTCGAQIRLALGPDLERRRSASIARHVERDPRHARARGRIRP